LVISKPKFDLFRFIQDSIMKICLLPLALLLGIAAAQPDCYTSTQELNFAQATDPRSNSERAVYSLCPGVAITVGFPADETFTLFAGGDMPLTVLRPNTTIDGNGAVISGGQFQFATQAVYVLGGTMFADPKQGTIIKNIVFDGTGLMPVNGLNSYSMYISGPGDYIASNITFKNIGYDSCGSQPVFVGPNFNPQLAPMTTPGSVDLTLEDSTFVDVSVSNCTSLFLSENQIITAKNLVYENVEASAAISLVGGSLTIENVSISESKFTYAPFSNVGAGLDTETSSVSGLYLADSVESTFCGSNLLYSDTDGNEMGICSCPVATADSCFASTSAPSMPKITIAPNTSDAPKATDAPTDGDVAATEPPTDGDVTATEPPTEESAAVSVVASTTILMASLAGFSLTVF